MGRFASRLLAESPGFRVVLELGRAAELKPALAASGAELGLDFTIAGRGFEHGAAMLEAGIRPVIGTSGVTLAENAELDRLAHRLDLGGLVVPNFSVGIWLLQRAALEAARHLPRVSIRERHHSKKVDAPSGTALDTAERLAEARGGAAADIPIESERLPDVYAEHEVVLEGRGEVLRLSHAASGPEAFGPGILLALEHAAGVLGVERGLGVALALSTERACATI